MRSLPTSLRIAVAIAAVAALGSLLLAVAHAGVTVPLLSALGPDGNAVVLPAVVVFSIGAVLFAALAAGLTRRSRAAWVGGLVLSAGAILSGIGQFRGVVSAVGIAMAVVLVGLLLMPPSRAAVASGTP